MSTTQFSILHPERSDCFIAESKIENENERASLIINMKIQRDWSEMTMLCKGLQGIGMENIAYVVLPPTKAVF